MKERIQKIISQCGIASRRAAEELIQEGVVTVNGKVAELGMKADLGRDHIKVNGKLISSPASNLYLILNKPPKCITAMNDPEKRPIILDYLKRVKGRVFPVGRLDYNSEGLLILTNDGELANAIMHPKKKIPKTYRVKINGFLEDKAKLQLENGVRLDDGMTKPAIVRVIKTLKANSWISITIHEGRNRQVRRMMDRVGHSAIKLIRTKIGSLTLGTLRSGEYRYLTEEEIALLKEDLKTGGTISTPQATKGPSRKGWATKSSSFKAAKKKPKRQTAKGSGSKTAKSPKSTVAPKVSKAASTFKKPRRQPNPRGVGAGRKKK